MANLPLIGMGVLNGRMESVDNFRDILAVADIDARFFSSSHEEGNGDYSSPIRLNVLLIALVLRGSARICLDYMPYTIQENMFVTIMPAHIFQMAETDSRFEAKLLLVDMTFMDECRGDHRRPSLTHYMQLRKHPCTLFLPEETQHTDESIRYLRNKIRQRTHLFHREVVQNAFVGFLLEVINILTGKSHAPAHPALSRKEELLINFLALLFDNAKQHHAVTYYAQKLSITPQYLSLILREATGKSANKWIDEALVTEARILLRTPEITIQQIADRLNFADQSVFGKFFKKHTGISPARYRRS